ncbi:hypothetical protein KEM55_006334 [Ascosphaera atra]|nr:hypothetical protein KEM55_006334 [Ascosphaera atra]
MLFINLRGGRRAQSLTGKEKEKENDAPASASASGALSTANVDQLANGVRRLHLKLNGPKPIPEEGNNGGAARVGTARTATAAAPTLRGRKSVPHLSAQRSSVLDSRRAPASKRTSASVSASHASNDRLPDPHSPGFSSPFQHSVTSEAVSEPPKSPPSISASASVSMGSEASLRTVEGFPRDEIPKEMLAPYEVQQLRSGSEAQNVGLASLGSFATVKGEVNRD